MYLAFDTETTGLEADSQVLTAHFMILDSDLNVVSELNLKIRYPVYHVSVRALEINRINLIEHDRTAIDLFDAQNALFKFLNTNRPAFRYIPIGHNIAFDIAHLKSSCILTVEAQELISTNAIDTLTIAQFLKMCRVIPKQMQLKLTRLCEHFDIDTRNAHDSSVDIKMTVELLKCFKGTVASDNSVCENKKRKLQ